VEDLALCRLEADRKVALVNMAWGLGPGGMQVAGTKGRLTVRYADDGTPPWAPFESLTVTTEAGTRTEPLPAGKELRALVLESMQATVLDVADALAPGRRPAADGAQALHILETTLAAYASAALGRTVPVTLSPDDPIYRSGVTGIRELDVPDWSPVRRDGLFGLRD